MLEWGPLEPGGSRGHFLYECTVPQPSIMIIYNCTWSILIQQIRIILLADNLTQPGLPALTITLVVQSTLGTRLNLTQQKRKKTYFLFVVNLITRSKKICHLGRSLKICGTSHCMIYDHNKYFELIKFQSGYRKFYLNSPKGFSRKIINVQTENILSIFSSLGLT